MVSLPDQNILSNNFTNHKETNDTCHILDKQTRSTCNMIEEVAVGERIAYWIRTPQVGTVLSTELPTVDHHDSIKLSVRGVWKVGEGFPGRVSLKTLKWVAVYSGDVLYQWIAQRQVRSPPCLYTL